MEKEILEAAITYRPDFNELKRLQVEHYLGDDTEVIWRAIEDYYEQDQSAQSIDTKLLRSLVELSHPKHELLHEVISQLEATSGPNILKLVLEQRIYTVSMKLSQAFASGKLGEVELLLEEYEMLNAGKLKASDTSEVVKGADIEGMMEKRSDAHRIPMLPNVLNAALEGGPSRGHHIVLYAVTDMGKTLFTLNMIRGFIASGAKVLYVCNEDPMTDLVERLLVSICSEKGKDKFAIRKHPRQAGMFAKQKGWDNLIWAALSPGTLGEIRSIIEEHRPDVLVVDQIRNLHTGDKSFVRVLEVAAQGMRNFAKKYNLLAVSVTQAGDSANGKAILNRGDIDSSNVGIPGTADLMMGLGGTPEQEANGERIISFAKNKISGNKIPIAVQFNMKTMRVE